MKVEVLHELLFGPRMEDGCFFDDSDLRWESDGQVGHRGSVEQWKHPHIPFAAGLVFLPVQNNDLVAFREVVPRANRSGLLVHAVLLPGGAASALDALALREQLKLDLRAAEDLAHQPWGGPPTVKTAGHTAKSVSPAGLDMGTVASLRSAITVQDANRRPVAVVAPDEDSVFRHLQAALATLPRDHLRSYYFSTLEAVLEDPELRLVGVVEAGWRGAELEEEFSRVIRVDSPSSDPGWLSQALGYPGVLEYLQSAPTIQEWAVRDAHVQEYFSGAALAPELVSMLIQHDLGALACRSEDLRETMRTLLDREDSSVSGILGRADQLTNETAYYFGQTLNRHGDAFLMDTLPALSDHARLAFWTSVEQIAARESEWHPGCAAPGCPIREAAYARMRSDEVLREQVRMRNPRLVPLELQPPAQALRLVLRTPEVLGHVDDRLPGIDATACARAVLEELQVKAVPPDELARNLFAALHHNPRLEADTHLELLSRPQAFAFASGPYMRAVLESTEEAGRPKELLCRLFSNTSVAFDAWGIPPVAIRYLPGPLSGDLSSAPNSIEGTVLSQAFSDPDATRTVLSDVLTRVEPQWAREAFWQYRSAIASTLGIDAGSSPLWRTPVYDRAWPPAPHPDQSAWDPAQSERDAQSPLAKMAHNPWLVAGAIVAVALAALMLGFLLLGRLLGPSEPSAPTPTSTPTNSTSTPAESEATTGPQRKEEQPNPNTASPETSPDAASPAESPAILIPQP